jgi:Trk K+ transport system NAD-binding subunit
VFRTITRRGHGTARRPLEANALTFAGLMAVLLAIILVYSAGFQAVMSYESRSYSWLSGFYWTVQTMSTLGYGDIVFESDVGHVYSVAVLATGVTILFIFLPFTLIQFFYAPWLERRAASRAPSALPPGTRGHVLLTAHGPIETALIERLDEFGTPYAVIVPEVSAALALHDRGINVVVGKLDDAETYRRARADSASLVATTLADATNANVALTVRAVAPVVPIVATAAWETSAPLLKRAGCREVIQLGEMLGRALAVRIAGQYGFTHVVGQLDDLILAEASAANTALVGHTLGTLGLRERLGVSVAGVWERGRYVVGARDVEVRQDSVLLLAGSASELAAYDREVQPNRQPVAHAIVIGGGRVGRSTSRALTERGIHHTIVEQAADRIRDSRLVVVGDAADPAVLERAGIAWASSLAVTTRDDDVNVFVTLLCRELRPEALILACATHERNIPTLYQAGADVVLSYFPMEANAIFGVLRQGNLLLLAEGLDVFTVPVPAALAGQTIASSRVRQATGCNVLAVRPTNGPARPADPTMPLPADGQIVLIGDRDAARRYHKAYGDLSRSASRGRPLV